MGRPAVGVDVRAVGRGVAEPRRRAPSSRRMRGAARNAAPLAQSTTTCRPSSLRPSSVATTCVTYSSTPPLSSLATPTPVPAGPGSGATEASSSSSRSTRRSRSSGIFRPPGAKNLMPLSTYGLWLAEITAAGASRVRARCAMAGVGTTPTSITFAPSAHRPATSAASTIGPDRRVSRPMTNGPSEPSTRAAGATERGHELRGELAVGDPTNAVGAEAKSHRDRPPGGRRYRFEY